MSNQPATVPRYATITVTREPDPALWQRQLGGLGQAAIMVVVDNGSSAPIVERLRQAVAQHSRALLLPLGQNRGLAAGLNAGAAAALQRVPDCAYLVFLDQDTEPGPAGTDRLVLAAERLRRDDPQAGLVGPLMVDGATGLSHGIHRVQHWRWARTFPGPADIEAMRCASVNGSGMVVPADLFRSLGGFDESFFIDHVDTEYSFRASRAGYHLYTVPAVRFSHRMGERSIRYWLGGWRVWPYRPPARHYYLFRNAMILMKRPNVPLAWKLAAPVKLLVTLLVHLVSDPARRAQLGAMLRGTCAGLRSRAATAAGPGQPGALRR